jgi:hypothetical protein
VWIGLAGLAGVVVLALGVVCAAGNGAFGSTARAW